MDPLTRIERLILGLALIAAVATLIGVGKIDATAGLGYMTGAVGLVVTGTLVSTKLGQPTAATGSKGLQVLPPTSVPVAPSQIVPPAPTVPIGGPGNPGV